MALTMPKASQINFDLTNISDPIIRLNSGESGSADKDTGIVLERGSDTNVALLYDESANQFALVNTNEDGTTSGNVTIASYAPVKLSNLIIADAGNIGSASDTDAIAISSGGVVTMNQIPVFSAGINVSGGTIVIPDAGSIGSASDTNAITISSGGVVAVTATTASTSATTGALVVGGGVGIGTDINVGDDIVLRSDSSVIHFGADAEVTLTHVHNDGLLLNADMQLQFRDSAINIRSDADGDLDINADDEIELNSTLIDINGNLDVSGTGTVAGALTSGNFTIANPGVGNTSIINFAKTNDTAQIRVTEYSSDSTAYNFYMADNPSGTADYFQWLIASWTGDGADWVPLKFSNFDLQIVSDDIDMYGDLYVRPTQYFGGNKVEGTHGYSGGGVPGEHTKYSVSGSLDLSSIDVSGFTGTEPVTYTIIIDGTGSPNTFKYNNYWRGASMVASTVAITGSAQTLNNGVKITFDGTTGGAADDEFQFKVVPGGSIIASGVLKTDDTTEATSTTDGSLQTDGGLSVVKDAVFGNDVKLLSDAAVVAFGADSDVTLTHVADTGLLLNSTMQLQFNDASQNINAPSATVLDINATDEIELNATLLDVNANINASGTYTGAGTMTTGGNIVIPNAGTIGSASDTDAIAIASDGVVTMNQIPVFSAGINVSGGTIAGTLATAAQTNITSLGTLTALQVDNININGNAITSTAGTDLTISPLSGQQIVLDGTIVIDAGVVTGATSITSTAFVGDITGAVTGNADTATTLATARTIGGVSFNGSANIDLPYTSTDNFMWRNVGALTSTSTANLLTELLGDDVFDSNMSAFKTTWSYAGNGDLTDAGRLTELAGTSWLTWTDNSTDNTQGNITALVIAPNTGDSANKMFVYNNQDAGGGSYSPGWREIWTSTSDGSGSGLDADLLDGLDLHTGRNNEANKVVRTQANGYVDFGWINTTSGATTSTIDKIYASNDSYMRYVTPATLISQLGLLTTGNNITIGDAGTIGSASDADAIAIAADGVVTMNQIPVFSAGINVSGGTIAGTLATAAQTNITSLGTLTALQVDNININGNAITSTAGTDLTITPLAGQQIVLDGTIVVDAGVVTGATSITSTAFVGDITGDVTGNADTATLATSVTVSANNSTNETVYPVFVDGATGTQGAETDTGLTYNPSTGLLTSTGFSGNLTGTLQTAAQGNVTSLGTLTTLTVDNIIINGTTIGHTSDTDAISISSGGDVTLTKNLIINAQGDIRFADADSSNWLAFQAPNTVGSNVTWTLPSADGTEDQVLSTNGSGTLAWADAGSGGSSSGSSYPNSTVSTMPGSAGNYDLGKNTAQDTAETPFEAGGADAFGVNLGTVYSMMDPAGTTTTVDLGTM